MIALGYALLSAALKYGHVQFYPEWWVHYVDSLLRSMMWPLVTILVKPLFCCRSVDHERQFLKICHHLARLEQLTMATLTTVIDTRKSNPKKVYMESVQPFTSLYLLILI